MDKQINAVFYEIGSVDPGDADIFRRALHKKGLIVVPEVVRGEWPIVEACHRAEHGSIKLDARGWEYAVVQHALDLIREMMAEESL